MALQCTMSYFGENEDNNGMPDPWFHYLVVASPGMKEGTGIASIFSLSAARQAGIAQEASETVIAKEGGPDQAINMAEELLDRRHSGLKKIVSDMKTR